jgi:L-ascorbate metabolism protein UlaG (beta-lactamase superfamily)
MVDIFKTKNGKEIKITFIKHASLNIDFDGVNVVIDPVSEYADYTKFPKANYIFVTHEHFDHCDKKAVADVSNNKTEIIANQSARNILGSGRVVKNGDKLELGNLKIEVVPAYNTTKTFHPKGRDNGYIFEYDSFRIYIAGDTENIDEMKTFKNIDIAFIPVNQPYTMTLEQAKDAINNLQAKIVYPYHYGETNVKTLIGIAEKVNVRIRNMQ